MAHRRRGQLSLTEGLFGEAAGRCSDLDRLAGLLDWAALDGLVGGIHGGAMGRPGYPPGLLLRCLLLQQWHRLRAAGLEEALADRLSFRRFAGLGLGEPVPDASTLCRFRQALLAAGLQDRLLAEVNRQLDGQGLILRIGTMIDASLVAADARRPRRGQPVGSGSDPDARWASRANGRTCFGYKMHAAVDETSQLIRRAILTSAQVGDSPLAEALIQGDEAMVLADRAYAKEARRRTLAGRGIGDGILRKRRQGEPRDPADRDRNAALSRRRQGVERVFGCLKRWYGMVRVRYRDLARNHLHLQLLAIAYNLRRAMVLVG